MGMSPRVVSTFFVSLLVGLATSAQAAVPATLQVEGVLLDSAGRPVTDTVNMRFELYASGDQAVCFDGSESIEVTDGNFSAVLSDITCAFTSPHTLRVSLDEEVLSEMGLPAAPYALHAQTATSADVALALDEDAAVPFTTLSDVPEQEIGHCVKVGQPTVSPCRNALGDTGSTSSGFYSTGLIVTTQTLQCTSLDGDTENISIVSSAQLCRIQIDD